MRFSELPTISRGRSTDQMIADGGNSQRARLERIGDFPNKPTSEEDDDQTDRERERERFLACES